MVRKQVRAMFAELAMHSGSTAARLLVQSLRRRVHISRDGFICPEAGLSIPRRTCLSRGGPMCPEVGPPKLLELLEAFPEAGLW